METIQASKTCRVRKGGKRHPFSGKDDSSRAGDLKSIAASKDKLKPLAISHFEKATVSTSSDDAVAPQSTSTMDVAMLVKEMEELKLEKSSLEAKLKEEIRGLVETNKKLELENELLDVKVKEVQHESNYSLTLHLSEKAKNDRLGYELVVATEKLAGRALTFEEKMELVAKAEGYEIVV